MQINDLKLKIKRPKKKTIGRGGKKGTYSGRGVKGQKSRSGANVDPLFEGGRSTLIDRMKKKKGFKSKKAKKTVVKFSSIEKRFENGAKITVKDLIEKKLVKKSQVDCGVKILGPAGGKNNFSFEKEILVSKSVLSNKE
ncbi:MAG: 50S ribosomal protein L15 [Candidatus Moranbacteria bacterium CG_4_8_14_3_um_filter_34_16]|nr:MAG: 50S ribosomal protein L15 [Candidatus Moranbacteria bacterium CG08_land_8_20_14_0_20_34_16]PIW95295.1 MAG: 50S ribosomal protein L15 [Candidatus Moranbacteria bacterium CG_4_8_14_3_um_filter_34_16]PJA89242.1 MAG: 50S ribosomal protein L15 [Candidatus Moranbacteria bacterium CG_4_9_14_3_um_filter_33_15]